MLKFLKLNKRKIIIISLVLVLAVCGVVMLVFSILLISKQDKDNN